MITHIDGALNIEQNVLYFTLDLHRGGVHYYYYYYFVASVVPIVKINLYPYCQIEECIIGRK